MPIDKTTGEGQVQSSAVQIPVAPPSSPLPESAAPSAPVPDPKAAVTELQAMESGGQGARPPNVPPASYLGNVLADLSAVLRVAGMDITVPKVPAEFIKAPSRGGVMVKTSAGWIQLGLPMWTNKDAFGAFAGQGGFGIPKEELAAKIPHMIPLVYVVDTDYVDHMLGTDFLQYMFFVTKGTRFTMVAQSEGDAAKIQRFLDLSYEGPRSEALSASVAAEYPEGARGIPNMMAELTRGFGGSPPSNAMRAIEHLDDKGEFVVSGVTIRKVGPMQYEVVDQGQSLGIVDLKDYPIPTTVKPVAMDPELQAVRQKALIEGRPGLWAIGTGHGFVPGEETSGFMIFGQGREGSGKIILVDPPSSTPDYLLANGIPPEAVDGVILTHGHTDHYGDAVPKLLRLLPKAKVYTTPTIFKMLQEQYEVGVGGKNEGLTQWNFVPVRPQTFTEIVGLNFRFDYGFHTVPTIGFDIYDTPDLQNGRCVAFFSGDTFADFANIWSHTQKGPTGEDPIMSMARAFNVTRHLGHIMGSQGLTPPIVGLVEAGMAPIHTDPASTRELLAAAQARGVDVSGVLVYHIAAKAASDAGVAKWEAGHKGFIDLSGFFPDFIPTTEVEYAARILDKMPLLDELGPDLKAAILRNGTLKKVPAGTVLLKYQTIDDTTFPENRLYFLIDGEVQISKDGQVVTTRPNGLFGEAVLLDELRNADVTTTTDSFVLEVDAGDLPVKVVDPLKSSLQRVRANRTHAYDVVRNQSPLSVLPDSILDVLMLKAQVREARDGESFIREGDSSRDVFVVLDGVVKVHSQSQGLQVTLGKGAMLGEMAMIDGRPRVASVTAEGPVKLLKFPADRLKMLADKYPGIAIAMGRTAERREVQNGNGKKVVNPPKETRGFATVETIPLVLPFTVAREIGVGLYRWTAPLHASAAKFVSTADDIGSSAVAGAATFLFAKHIVGLVLDPPQTPIESLVYGYDVLGSAVLLDHGLQKAAWNLTWGKMADPTIAAAKFGLREFAGGMGTSLVAFRAMESATRKLPVSHETAELITLAGTGVVMGGAREIARQCLPTETLAALGSAVSGLGLVVFAADAACGVGDAIKDEATGPYAARAADLLVTASQSRDNVLQQAADAVVPRSWYKLTYPLSDRNYYWLKRCELRLKDGHPDCNDM